MALASSFETHPALSQIRPLDAPAPWHAALLPVGEFPIPQDYVEVIRHFLKTLTDQEIARTRRGVSLFLQVYQLHLDQGPARLQENAVNWRPALGLGVWSHEPPPHFYTREEFENLDLGEQPRTLMNYLFHITDDAADARDTMLGRGTVLQIMSADPVRFVTSATERFRAWISDPTFTSFPFYVPLLQASWITTSTAAEIDNWMYGADLYIRESREDAAILLLSRDPLQPILERSLQELPDRG